MLTVLMSSRKSLAHILLMFGLFLVTACQPIGGGGPVINLQKPIPVALLVPSGSENPGHMVVAQSLENAARLAISDLNGVQIDLRVYPTAGQPELAAQSARQAVNDGARIILGPVFAEAANAAGLAVSGRNVNVLSFSNNTEIAGGNVFVLGNTFQNTANRLARFAVSQGKTSTLIVNGDSFAENIGRDAISRAMAGAGGYVAGVVSFPLNQTDLINAVPAIAEEVKTTGAQSVFFTSGTDGAIPILTQLVKENGVDPQVTQYIGLQRWDVPSSALALPGVQNGWFALPDPALSSLFENRYSAAYGVPPHPLAGLAYDGIAAIGALAANGQSDALTVTALTQPSGFRGVNGVFRLYANGTNERGLAIATILDNQVVVISPAPTSFDSVGF